MVKDKRSLIGREHKRLSIKRQCELLGLKRSSYYFKPKGFIPEDYAIMRRMDEIFTEHPYYGCKTYEACFEKGRILNWAETSEPLLSDFGDRNYPKMNLNCRNQAHKVFLEAEE